MSSRYRIRRGGADDGPEIAEITDLFECKPVSVFVMSSGPDRPEPRFRPRLHFPTFAPPRPKRFIPTLRAEPLLHHP